jgi:transcriptional regulator with XRE-family HTH domain
MPTEPKAAILLQFGQRVRKLREAKSMSQEQLGFESDLDRTYISGIERGQRNVALLNIKKIAQALGVSISQLFDSIE